MHFSQVRLQSAALLQLRYFYRQVLGFTVDGNDEMFKVYAGTTVLQFEQSAPGTYPAYHIAFNIPCNKIEEARNWLQHRVSLLWIDEYNSEIADFTNWHAKSVYFLDPAGNVLEFIARFDLNDDESAAFSPAQTRCISEVGLVFDEFHFEDQVAAFMQQHGLTYFDKQPPLPQFRAIGNDNGLFIAVPANRAWFPTKNQLSMQVPMSVVFEKDDASEDVHYTVG